MKEIVFPKSLKKGDRIAVISPAGSVEESQLAEGLKLIQANGYEPVLGNHVYTKFPNGYSYAGTEAQRTQDLNWALNDGETSAIWASRGGYGCQHLLEGVQLAEFSKNPKWFIGYSDNTVIQSYLLKKGFASIHAQTVKTSGFGVSTESYEQTFDILKGKLPHYFVERNQYSKPGYAEGMLVGGNLALVYALLGTPYSFDFEDKILFIEDIGEKFYALDRMLMSLEMAGVFRKIKGLIVGGMTLMEDEKDNRNYNESFDEFSCKLISERISRYDFPVVFGFPNGHIFDNRPLIIGANIKMKSGDICTMEF